MTVKHTVHAHRHTYRTGRTHGHGQDAAAFSPLHQSLSHKSILLLISWLHICLLVVFFFLSIKHLLLLVYNVTLHIVCCLSGGADLEGPVWTIALQIRPQAVIKHMPSANATLPSHRRKTQTRHCRKRETQTGPETHTATAHRDNGSKKQCISEVQAEEERR